MIQFFKKRKDHKKVLKNIINKVEGWQDVSGGRGRFWSHAFYYRGVEIGHIHKNGMLDLEVSSDEVGEYLLNHGYAIPHHIYPHKDVYRSFHVKTENDISKALWLLRLSYIYHVYRTRAQAAVSLLPYALVCEACDIPQDLAELLAYEFTL